MITWKVSLPIVVALCFLSYNIGRAVELNSWTKWLEGQRKKMRSGP